MRKITIFIVGLTAIILFSTQQTDFVYGTTLSENELRQTSLAPSQLKNIDKIQINGEQDFLNQASENNWPGDGSSSTPFVIDGYNTNYIEISKTNDTYFILQNNTISDLTTDYFVLPKIVLTQVTGAIVRTNSIISKYYGISLHSTQSSEISDNSILIELLCGSCNSFGIYLNDMDGDNSFGNVIRGNYIDGYGSGIILFGYDNFIYSNYITYSSLDQWGGSWGHDIHILSNGNEITRNTISNKYGYGVLIQEGERNKIFENNFISNSISLSSPSFSYKNQAGDFKYSVGPYNSSDYNLYESSYWSDWTALSIDSNNDNILDDPYTIDNNWNLIEDISPSTLKYHVIAVLNIDDALEDTKEDDKEEIEIYELLILPFQGRSLIGILISVISIGFLSYYKLYTPRMKKETISITKKIGNEISSIFQNHRSFFI
ncbi:MAG: hypothetical protein HeimC2_02280 [Candidatus Heimdallarchaeota archaeon LC_2]|nr:MAG: hypothetical protein HeimC2_02280 [Candidatus Heimdallarchaeota archaeon LC_2]